MTHQPNAKQATSAMHLALHRMVRRYPYHAEWLSPDRWRQRSAVGTMAVTLKHGAPRFFYSATFACSCSEMQLQGVIHHELNHVVFRHPLIDPASYPNRHALTIAEEVTVNEHVPEPLPGDPLTLSEFPELPAGEGTIVRYHRLAKRNDLQDRVRMLDMHSLWDQGKTAAEMAVDLETDHQTMLQQLLRERSREAMQWALSGIGLHDGTGMIENLCDHHHHAKPVDWNQVLLAALGQRAQREAAFHRPPRRMPDHIGIIPAMVCRPEKPPVMVAIDTSSSMKRQHFERIKGELEQLRKIAEVVVVQCDKVIRNTYALRGPLQTIVGRGGTDLRPPLEAEFLNRYRPGMVVYFTDGDGRAPKQEPSVPVVWCLTADAKTPAPWGRVVKLT